MARMDNTNSPYVYVGQVNLFNKVEAGAELAVLANDVLNKYIHSEEFTGFIHKGMVTRESEYFERLKRIGFTEGEEGDLIPPPHPLRQLLFDKKGEVV